MIWVDRSSSMQIVGTFGEGKFLFNGSNSTIELHGCLLIIARRRRRGRSWWITLSEIPIDRGRLEFVIEMSFPEMGGLIEDRILNRKTGYPLGKLLEKGFHFSNTEKNFQTTVTKQIFRCGLHH